MLTIRDLHTSKDLDDTAMRSVTGGMSRKAALKFMSHTDYGYTELVSMQSVGTLQDNSLMQSAGIGSIVEGKGGYAAISGGHNTTHQSNTSVNYNG